MKISGNRRAISLRFHTGVHAKISWQKLLKSSLTLIKSNSSPTGSPHPGARALNAYNTLHKTASREVYQGPMLLVASGALLVFGLADSCNVQLDGGSNVLLRF